MKMKIQAITLLTATFLSIIAQAERFAQVDDRALSRQPAQPIPQLAQIDSDDIYAREVFEATKKMSPSDRQDFLDSKCKYVMDSGTTFYDMDKGISRDACLEGQMWMIINYEYRNHGLTTQENRGTIYYRSNSTSRYTACTFHVSAGKKIPNVLVEQFKKGNFASDEQSAIELSRLVDFECVMS